MIKCYSCEQIGHTMAQCPLKTSNSPSNTKDRRNQLIRTDESCCSSSSTQVGSATPMFDGENIMLKMSLKIEPPQRKSLFRTQGKAYGKLCKIIVDFGSTKNVVSLEMAEKCKLKRLPHLDPHKISWLNKSHSFIVEEQALV